MPAATCPSCSAKIRYADGTPAKTAKCPKCGEKIVVGEEEKEKAEYVLFEGAEKGKGTAKAKTAFVAIVVMATAVVATEPQMVNGSIVKVDGSKITVATKDGEKTVWAVGNVAPVIRDGKTVDYGELKPGVQVSIMAEGEDAKKIRIVGAKEEKPKNLDVEFAGIKTSAEKIVYVIDASKSMDTYKVWPSVKNAVVQSVDKLSSDQQFEVVFYRDDAKPLGLRPGRLSIATRTQIDKAKEKVSAETAFGGTAYDAALNTAFSFNPDVVFFLTDGQGFNDSLVASISRSNKAADKQRVGSRIFVVHIELSGYLAHAVRETKDKLSRIAFESNGGYRIVNAKSILQPVNEEKPQGVADRRRIPDEIANPINEKPDIRNNQPVNHPPAAAPRLENIPQAAPVDPWTEFLTQAANKNNNQEQRPSVFLSMTKDRFEQNSKFSASWECRREFHDRLTVDVVIVRNDKSGQFGSEAFIGASSFVMPNGVYDVFYRLGSAGESPSIWLLYGKERKKWPNCKWNGSRDSIYRAYVETLISPILVSDLLPAVGAKTIESRINDIDVVYPDEFRQAISVLVDAAIKPESFSKYERALDAIAEKGEARVGFSSIRNAIASMPEK